ncbi:MAG: isochorismatase family protein [Polyangiaceae bacterium]|nr:isochorismatase family protein [Polyangiaceae bacterium]
MDRLDPKTSIVVVVDVQEKLAAAMPPTQMEALMRAAKILVEASQALEIPVIATEQYPQGLGPTVPALREQLASRTATVLPKTEFSAAEAPGFSAALANHRAKSIIVVGMETHVCVFQTVRELVGRGLSVHVPIDGVASRRDDHRQVGLDLCRAAGATITTAETIAFDWLRKAEGDAFKRVSKAVR